MHVVFINGYLGNFDYFPHQIQEIRDRLIAEEQEECLRTNGQRHQRSPHTEKKGKGGIRRRKKTSPTSSALSHTRRLSLPANFGVCNDKIHYD